MIRLSIPSAAIASAVLLGLSSGAALAQSNTLTILQQGSGNTLKVDQSGASGSEVGGLTMSKPTARSFVQVIERDVEKTIENPLSQQMETVVVRETETRNITLDTLSASAQPDAAARQVGRNNKADVTINGLGGFVGLLQDSGTSALGNSAIVNLSGGGDALVGQNGSANSASMLIGAAAAGGTILQDGDRNTAGLTVTGVGASGLISQVGTGLTNNLNVEGNGTSAALYANGVGLVDVTNGVSVISNGATVSITQNPM